MVRAFLLMGVLGVSSAVLAQAPDPCSTVPQSCATQISTRATSRTRIANTVVDATVGVEATGKDMAEVQRQISENTARLMRYLKAQGAERLMTQNVSFSPETQTQKNGPDKTVGYRGSVQVSFRTTPEKVPDLLGGVLQNGANTVDGTNFQPSEKEIEAAQRLMAAEATKTAQAEADAIAKAAGLTVVAVRSINVQNESMKVPRNVNMMMGARAGMAAAAPIATEAGDQEISASVEITVAAK